MFREICDFLGRRNHKWTLHIPMDWFPICANQLGWSEDDRRRLGHWAPGSQMMERYDRAACATELRLGSAIFGKITNGQWEPARSFEAPIQVGDASANNTGLTTAPNHNPNERDGLLLTQQQEPAELSGDDTSTSSVTRGNKSGALSGVAISDLYSGY